jgi:PPOX class probable F420-dependent enzyme
MEFEEARPFLESNHRAVVNTIRPDGAAQSSLIVAGAYQGHAAFVSIRGRAIKVRNLRRNPHCTITTVVPEWRSFVVVEGQATLKDHTNTEAEELRLLLRDVYRACGDSEHPDWEEYDRVMHDQQAVVVLVRPDRVYGLLR